MNDTAAFEIGVAVINVLILIIGAWIKADLSSLKLYMHKNFVSREELKNAIDMMRPFPFNQKESR